MEKTYRIENAKRRYGIQYKWVIVAKDDARANNIAVQQGMIPWRKTDNDDTTIQYYSTPGAAQAFEYFMNHDFSASPRNA
jgi:hypothetical protein